MAVSQIRIVRSLLAVASQVPAGPIATALIEPVWPVRAARCWPLGRVPDPHSVARVGTDEPGAVRADRHGRRSHRAAGEICALLASSDIQIRALSSTLALASSWHPCAVGAGKQCGHCGFFGRRHPVDLDNGPVPTAAGRLIWVTSVTG